ncbi:fumarylacetoacetate hydrolase family protein [Vibrio sp. JCM 19236]|nr:fumarylacetoacetate hydrolase family protein [Vibrio sp. JCM 19236]
MHFEGEMVLVIGKTAKEVSLDDASDYIWGVTVGNDLTERSWQGRDLQWMRAKASDGFGPIAPTITKGINYKDVMLTTRLNGKVVQQESTKNMIHSPEKVVNYLSHYFTLKPGDLIFMGTPGRTKASRTKTWYQYPLKALERSKTRFGLTLELHQISISQDQPEIAVILKLISEVLWIELNIGLWVTSGPCD